MVVALLWQQVTSFCCDGISPNRFLSPLSPISLPSLPLYYPLSCFLPLIFFSLLSLLSFLSLSLLSPP